MSVFYIAFVEFMFQNKILAFGKEYSNSNQCFDQITQKVNSDRLLKIWFIYTCYENTITP